jgi:hypothetical protein
MLSDQLKLTLPTTDELPCSDDTPVDNVDQGAWRSQDQNFLPKTAECPHQNGTPFGGGMNGSARAIPPDCNPTSVALGK